MTGMMALEVALAVVAMAWMAEDEARTAYAATQQVDDKGAERWPLISAKSLKARKDGKVDNANPFGAFQVLTPAEENDLVAACKSLISEAGLTIEREERCRLSRRDCEAFYAEHKERSFFQGLVSFMSSGPVVKMELSGKDAIKGWRTLIGPTNSNTAREQAPSSIRARFGTDQQRNAAHGSDSPESASREIGLMFK